MANKERIHVVNASDKQHPISTPTPVESSTEKITRRYIRGLHPARVTRISIESSQQGDVHEIKPRLKKGVRISAPSSEENSALVVASGHNAVSIHHPGARAIIAKFDGEHRALDISLELDAPLDVVEKVITQLKIAQMIDVRISKIRLHNRFQSAIAERAVHTEDQSNDASFKQLQVRMSPELSQTTWVDGVLDGGVELLSARQNFGVEIYGDNRLATLIYVALLASGVSQTKFSLASIKNRTTIADCDLGTGIFRTNDFGLGFNSRVEELTRDWSLFPTASKNVKGTVSTPIPARNLRVIVGEHSAELIDKLMRDGLDHLFVGETLGGSVYLGPLVQPGKSPCSRCISIGKFERHGVNSLSPVSSGKDEIPVALTYLIAGNAVQSILQLIDTGESELIGAQVMFNYQTPIHQPLTRYSRHPSCECHWKQHQSSNTRKQGRSDRQINALKSTVEIGAEIVTNQSDTILF